MIKTFVGYDLGDGETIVDRAVVDLNNSFAQQRQDFPGMTMPGNRIPGVAVPTAFAELNDKLIFSNGILQIPTACQNIKLNFKRRPTDLLPELTESRKAALLELFSNSTEWPTDEDFPEGNIPEFCEFKESVIRFTDAVFNDKANIQGNCSDFYNALKSAAFNSDVIEFCIGHPTKWNDLDVAIYKAIFRESILGQPLYAGKSTELIMAAESRAAFLYVKEATGGTIIPRDKCVLLMDIGSSTIDLTAMSADSRNHIYNSGSNYLGARGIDFVIRDWYLSELEKDPTAWQTYITILANNSSMLRALTLACRTAKENIFSNGLGISMINCAALMPMQLTKEKLTELAQCAPLGTVLSQEVSIPDEILNEMGQKSWTELLESFLCQQKKEMEEKGIEIARIILTGSASRMDFVKPIIKAVFNEISKDDILNDTDPSRTISKGLALAGMANERSKAFQADLAKFIQEKLPQIVEKNLPELADKLDGAIAKPIEEIVRKRMVEWREGKIRTFDDVSTLINTDLAADKLETLLSNNKEYNDAIESWIKNEVGKEIATELCALCTQYGVREFQIEHLNIVTVPPAGYPGGTFDPITFQNAIAAVVGVIAGIVAWEVIPILVGVVIGLVSVISLDLSIALLGALVAMDPVLLVALIGAAAFAVLLGAMRAGKKAMKALGQKLQSKNLPKPVRAIFSDKEIDKQIAKEDLRSKIKAGILADESREKLVVEVSNGLREAVERRVDDIRYVIEAR